MGIVPLGIFDGRNLCLCSTRPSDKVMQSRIAFCIRTVFVGGNPDDAMVCRPVGVVNRKNDENMNFVLAKDCFLHLRIRERMVDKMGPFDYVVVKLYGDYADLKRTDIESDELLMIARALLPDEVEEGTKLHYEMFEYTIVC